MIDFTDLGFAANLAVFAVAAVVVWIAGVRITRYGNVISVRAGLGQALVGMLLLGGVAMQVAILAVADMASGRQAWTAVVPDPVVFLQGAFKILLLSVVAGAIIVGDVAALGVGLWMWLLLALCIFATRTLARARGRRPWRIADHDLEGAGQRRADREAARYRTRSLKAAIAMAAVTGGVIVMAGYVLSRTGDAIAGLTGVGQSLIGAVLVAIATSLPEISTVMTAARAGLYTMAVSDVFGTNLFLISLLFVIDAAAGGDPVLNGAGRFSAFAAIIGITVTTMYLAGFAERRDRTILGMGTDSAAVLLTYLAGLVVLYQLR
jgi:cation:H+ antiporter